MAACPVRDSIQEISRDLWLVGNRLILSRTSASDSTWEDGGGKGFLISPAPQPLPLTRPLSDAGDIQLIHDAGDVSAVFRIGNEAFCKVRILDIANLTREHTTLTWLHARPWSFNLPRVLYHHEYNDRYFIFLSKAPGMTLDSLWPGLGESERELYAEKVVDVCKELKSVTGTTISGVDGQALSERYLCGRGLDCSPENLLKSCQELDMDCSRLVFYHCDLGPTNIIIDRESGGLSIIDWETAGFVPEEWIRTKFRISSGVDLSSGDEVDWRRRVGFRLGKQGYHDVTKAFSERTKRQE